MKPVMTAEMDNRKKKLEPTRPNSLGVRPSSCMIGTPARPMTVLSTKLISMKVKRRKTTTQALLPDATGIFPPRAPHIPDDVPDQTAGAILIVDPNALTCACKSFSADDDEQKHPRQRVP